MVSDLPGQPKAAFVKRSFRSGWPALRGLWNQLSRAASSLAWDHPRRV